MQGVPVRTVCGQGRGPAVIYPLTRSAAVDAPASLAQLGIRCVLTARLSGLSNFLCSVACDIGGTKQ